MIVFLCAVFVIVGTVVVLALATIDKYYLRGL